MIFKVKRKAGFFVLITVLLAGIIGAIPAQAGAEQLTALSQPGAPAEGQDCTPNGAWMWTNGPFEPEVAARVQQELSRKGIRAIVKARSYGETDDCGTYNQQGIDFTITLADTGSMRPGLADDVLPVLAAFGKPGVGNVKLFSARGDVIPISRPEKLSTTQSLNEFSAALLPADAITRNVYVIVFDPLLTNDQKLSQYLGWNDHALITQQTIDFFQQATNQRMNYVVVDTAIVTSGWPELIDGFTYTENEYLAVLSGQQAPHQPTGVNYNKIVNSPQFDLCGRVNRGEIDEVWIYNGPWFGFYESILVGPGAYWLNSPPVAGIHNCNRLLPIMGPSPERFTSEAVHNFTHRAESTMTRVYGSWQQNNTSHNWNKFALVKAQSPDYSYSGCGSSHYPPNGTSDYDYGNLSNVLSNCDDFANYPNLGDPLQVAQPVNCTTWGCDGLAYCNYWFRHFPSYLGCGPDNVANDWWKYLTNLGYALYPSYACQADMHFISGNAGVGGTLLSYYDGSAKSVMADSSGNYFLIVSNHWSGTVTPYKLGYTFTPVSRDYVDVQSDLYDQNYTAQGADPSAYYVNVATGNNNNSCISIAAPCRDIQEAINKANDGDVIYVASGRYVFSTNPTPNVVIVDNKNITLSGGWSPDFALQNDASFIDGANVNNGILLISGNMLVENLIVENSISYNGGGIYLVNGNFTLKKSTLRNNIATSNGAGIFLDNGALTVVNSTISGNQANGSGGGIYASLNSSTSVTIQNSTIVYNRASTGGGIRRTNGTYNITNTIIANNTGTGSSPDCSGTIGVANYNIIENMAGCSITSGSNNLNVDPQIDSNLTGITPAHMPLAGSPAINAGTASGCPPTDQQGTARPQGSSCDIGSIEFVGDPYTPTFTPTFTPTHTATHTATFTPTFTPTNTFTPTATSSSSSGLLYLSLTDSQTIGAVASSDEDILRLDGQTWSLFFDGSDVGVSKVDLFAFSVVDADTILMAFSANVTVNGLAITPQDVVRFEATSLGSVTAGTFSMYLDGGDVGLDSTAEKIDSVSLLPDGRGLVSTTGNPSVPGVSGKDEDVLVFTPISLGDVTSGTWAMYFDGSDAGLGETSGEDVDALDVVAGKVYLSTADSFSVSGLSGFDEDVFVCEPTSLGEVTACNYSPALYFDGSTWGLSANDVDAFDFPSLGPSPTSTDTPTATPSSTPTNTATPTATATPSQTPGSSDLIFADGFESGNLSAWSSSSTDAGDLSVSANAALVGSYGLQAVIDDTTAIFLTDDRPVAEPNYRARFHFNPNSLTMASGEAHFLFKGFAGTGTEVLRVDFRFYNGAYQLRAGLLSDGTTWTYTNWVTISDAPHAIELDWRAASGV
ncbi:MAG TPA: right-handed parallel beta-helix repeat-containing protein, partial [Anaerolineales bacterium]|nr:right-handed parallel beta-helix repeat-containing protein [Anaerolineales bacterium]